MPVPRSFRIRSDVELPTTAIDPHQLPGHTTQLADTDLVFP
jgi:hypothetical protein